MPTEQPVPARLPGIDGVRGFACLIVVLGHLKIPLFEAGGMAGVHLFFVLSGFLITGLLLDEYARTGRVDLPAFWMRRAIRLLPALWLFLAVVFVVFWWAGWQSPGSLWRATQPSLLYYANFVPREDLVPFLHTWSLGVEEQFYLWWPPVLLGVLVLLRRVRPGRRPAALLAVLLGLTSLSAGVRIVQEDDWLTPSMPHTAAFALLAGGAVAVVHQRGWRPSPRLAVPGVVLGVPALLGLHRPAIALGLPADWVHIPFVQVAVGVVLVAAASGAARTPMHLGPLRRIGTVSYGWYLWHFPWLAVVAHGQIAPGHRTLGYTAVALGSLAAAFASWYLVERPLLRFKGRFERGRLDTGDGTPAVEAAAPVPVGADR